MKRKPVPFSPARRRSPVRGRLRWRQSTIRPTRPSRTGPRSSSVRSSRPPAQEQPSAPSRSRGPSWRSRKLNYDEGIDGVQVELVQVNDKADPPHRPRRWRSSSARTKCSPGPGLLLDSAAEADPVANDSENTGSGRFDTGPGIVGDCPYPCEFIFRDSLGEAEAIPANIGEYARVTNAKTAAILHPADYPFGASSAETAKKAFRRTTSRSCWTRSTPMT